MLEPRDNNNQLIMILMNIDNERFEIDNKFEIDNFGEI